MKIEMFRDIIAQRINVEEISHGEWTEGIDECLKKEIELLAEDVDSTIEFLKNDCTATEYYWISEVFEDVVDAVPNRDLVQCYKELKDKFPEEFTTYNIAGVIENAEAIIRWEDEHGKKD